MTTAFLTGLGTTAGLIIAIGAQNAYVLTQSVRRNHHIKIAMICVFFDVLFISIGVIGVGAFFAQSPLFMKVAAYGGAVFLFVYGALSLRSALNGKSLALINRGDDSLKKVVLTTIAVTVLNPHFYIDTVILLGGISSQFAPENRLMFTLGASTASAIWFYLLTFAGAHLAPLFSRPLTWRILDLAICAVMWSVAVSLLI